MEDLSRAVWEGREWSWSVAGLFAIIIGLLIRGLFLRDILHGIKIRNRSWYKRAQAHYQQRAILGWVFFILFILGVMLFWRFESFFLNYLRAAQWFVVFVTLLVISLFLHLRAYARALVEAVEDNVAADKDI
ncbi:MAG: hypothetical protein HY585_04750 [Candidatus Omnitrophica bacterium]|nr:hypothetical protein [Candidatus Omnitrophota bacterium]